MSRKRNFVLVLLGLLVALISAKWIDSAGYMDSDYYFAMGKVLATGGGLSEPFIWNYLDDPKTIPHPAFQYWMPFTSLLAAVGQALFGTGFRTAQIPFVLLAAFLPVFTAWIAIKLHGDPQLAWISGLLATVPGFFLPFLITTDSFAIYGIIGPVIFFLLVTAFRKGGILRWSLAGLLIGIAHLTRTDGILFLLLGLGLIFYLPRDKIKALVGIIAGYVIVMLPWWIANGIESGSVFASGTTRILWSLNYDELFSYPPDKLTFDRWLQSGLGNILLVRLDALWMNIKSLLLVNGLVFLGPLMFIGGWRLKKNLLVRLVFFYLISLLIIMSFIFPFAGSRGGYFHSSIAVMPILWALAPLGLEKVLELGVQYRNWNKQQSRDFFTIGTIALACLITLGLFWSRVIGKDFHKPTWSASTRVYNEVAQWLERSGVEQTIVAVNNPPGFYSASDFGAVVIPDENEEVLRQVLEVFDVSWLLLDSNRPEDLQTLYENPHQVEWLELIETLDDYKGKNFYIYKVLVNRP